MPSATVHVSAKSSAVSRAAALCGVPKACIKNLTGGEKPSLIDYLDLLPANDQAVSGPDLVAENRGRPLLYFIHRDRLSASGKDDTLRTLRRTLSSRGERAYLAVVEPGVVRVIPVSLDARSEEWNEYRLDDEHTGSLFSRLSLGHYDGKGEPENADYVFEAMYSLLGNVARQLAGEKNALDRSDVLSLVGRALFLRFLGDRGVVTAKDVHEIAPQAKKLEDCFGNARNAARTCKWLDKTFNGDFLPLTKRGSEEWFNDAGNRTNGAVFQHLSAILRAEEPAGDSYQPQLWSQFDFAHIPVGLLSQVYEEFCWRWDHEDAKATCVFYTPRGIASYTVEEAFDGVKKADKARVLDPACGAGVFLVLAFRRLYRERWEATGRRPQRKEIRTILAKQLGGFDISQSALRLAALSLYLTAIELDPKPTPLSDLIFSDLQGSVLFNGRAKDDPEKGAVLGSLSPAMLKAHRGKYDIVLCNPPWTSLSKKEKPLATKFHGIGKEVLEERKLPELAADYENPDSVPDLPFLWRAMQWTKRGGRMAFVLPARLLFKQGDIGQRAREAIFRAMTVTGMLNCSNLSDTDVWPKMQQPFLLFFAHNRVPGDDHEIRFVTPHYDAALNRRGEIRIDAKSVELVSQEKTFEEPWLWKALAVGTPLDVEIVRKIKACGGRPLEKYWKEDLGLECGNGYQIKADQEQVSARHLHGLPDVTAAADCRFRVELPLIAARTFTRDTAFRPRPRSLYRSPLVLIKEAPGLDRADGRAWLAEMDVAFNQSFHGFSSWGHKDAAALSHYIHLLLHTDIWMHYALQTSPKLGAERRVIYKEDLDEFPVIPWSELTATHKSSLAKLSERLLAEDLTVFDDIDDFFAQLYRLNARDIEVIRDTLRVELPYKIIRSRACNPPKNEERNKFKTRLESTLRPFFKRLGKDATVAIETRANAVLTVPYSVLTIRGESELALEYDSDLQAKVLALANESGASMIFWEHDDALVVAVLNQYRYWTPTRARLCAATILRTHMAPFEG